MWIMLDYVVGGRYTNLLGKMTSRVFSYIGSFVSVWLQLVAVVVMRLERNTKNNLININNTFIKHETRYILSLQVTRRKELCRKEFKLLTDYK